MQDDLRRAVETQFFQELHKTISKERLGPYLRSNFGGTAIDALTLYMYNAALSESLYVPLHNFEVGLRNRLHEALTHELHTEDWYINELGVFDAEGQQALIKAVDDVRSRKGDRYIPGDVVAALNLGFWQALFHESYKPLLKSRYTDMVFPYAPAEYNDANTKRFYTLIDSFRILRNRVFHCERIWNLSSPDVVTLHLKLVKAIGWMSPDLEAITKIEDRCPQLLKIGRGNYQTQCKQNLEEYFVKLVGQEEARRKMREEQKRLKKEERKASREAKKAEPRKPESSA